MTRFAVRHPSLRWEPHATRLDPHGSAPYEKRGANEERTNENRITMKNYSDTVRGSGNAKSEPEDISLFRLFNAPYCPVDPLPPYP